MLSRNFPTKLCLTTSFSVTFLEYFTFDILSISYIFLFCKIPYLLNFNSNTLLVFRTFWPILIILPFLIVLSKYIHISSSLMDTVCGFPINFITSFLLVLSTTSTFSLFSKKFIPCVLLYCFTWQLFKKKEKNMI